MISHLLFPVVTKISFSKTRDESETFFACIPIQIWTEEKEMYNFLEKYPKEKVYGAKSFRKLNSKEWGEGKEGVFFLPMLSFIKKKDEKNTFLKIRVPKSKEKKFEVLNKLDNFFSCSKYTVNNRKTPISSPQEENLPSFQEWSKQIEYLKDQIALKEIDKAVLARKKVITSENDICPFYLFKELEKTVKNSYQIFFCFGPQKYFISLTPECFFKIEDQKIQIDALAGTLSQNEDIDLKTSKKNLEEHRIVSHEIKKILSQFCTQISQLKDEEILELNHLKHLFSLFEGHLKNKYKFEDLVNSIHPTPAMGGHPKDQAMKILEKLENFDRGFYSSPCGIWSKNFAHLAVGIRSVLIDQKVKKLHFFAGAGIVKDSLSNSEWNETNHKMKTTEAYL